MFPTPDATSALRGNTIPVEKWVEAAMTLPRATHPLCGLAFGGPRCATKASYPIVAVHGMCSRDDDPSTLFEGCGQVAVVLTSAFFVMPTSAETTGTDQELARDVLTAFCVIERLTSAHLPPETRFTTNIAYNPVKRAEIDEIGVRHTRAVLPDLQRARNAPPEERELAEMAETAAVKTVARNVHKEMRTKYDINRADALVAPNEPTHAWALIVSVPDVRHIASTLPEDAPLTVEQRERFSALSTTDPELHPLIAVLGTFATKAEVDDFAERAMRSLETSVLQFQCVRTARMYDAQALCVQETDWVQNEQDVDAM